MKYALIAVTLIVAGCASETQTPPRASLPPPPISVAPTPDLPSVEQCGALPALHLLDDPGLSIE